MQPQNDASTQTDDHEVIDKSVQTSDTDIPADPPPKAGLADIGSKDNPFNIDDDEPLNNISDEGESDDDAESTQVPQEDKFFFGSIFEKVEEFDQCLDEPNPWHPDLSKPLFPSQIIGFRWMLSRHNKGGGLVGDKVGCGKVLPQTGN
jgi:SNF2 family DNA or RNA helicase